MLIRNFLVGIGIASLLATTSVPASAQVADFFCSTFSVGCSPPPPPPPPAPIEEPPPPVKKVRKKTKPKAKPKATAETAPATDAK